MLQGRHAGVEIIGVTQRPALVSADFRGNVIETYCFALAFDEDQRVMGRRYAPSIAALAGHKYLHFRDGAMIEGRAGDEGRAAQGGIRAAAVRAAAAMRAIGRGPRLILVPRAKRGSRRRFEELARDHGNQRPRPAADIEAASRNGRKPRGRDQCSPRSPGTSCADIAATAP